MPLSSGPHIADENQLSFPPGTLKPYDRGCTDAEDVVAKKSNRIPALDFTKGTLVLIMVLYHWMNYFVRADGATYKYLRFLTPSFIFIAGFLISQVYLSKYQASGRRVPMRLMTRGFKLLGIVLCLNVALSAMHLNGLKARVGDRSLSDLVAAYLTGTAPVAFSVLVPIAYLLLLSAGLLAASHYYRNVYHVSCGVFVACALLLEWKRIDGGYLQILSIGMLGISIGYFPIDKVNGIVRRSMAIFVLYLAYLFAITSYDDAYLLQVIGVLVSLAVIYSIGLRNAEGNRVGKMAILLGQYSLFAYIAQIMILQILRWCLRPFGTGIAILSAAFVACLACTILGVEILNSTRAKIAGVNRVYMAVFG